MNQIDLLSISDFITVLIKRKLIFLSVFLFIMALTVLYLVIAKPTYRLKGVIYVGRFQEILLEEGEFVAQKLEDYSFMKSALEAQGVELDMPVTKLARLVHTSVVNEVKKIKDVGIVELTVDYPGQEMALKIFNALTLALIEDHQKLYGRSAEVFAQMESQFLENEEMLRQSLQKDEAFLKSSAAQFSEKQTVPSHLLASHTISEKREFLKTLIKDRHYLRIEADSATKSYNTKLAAPPQLPDAPVKPQKVLVLLAGTVLAGLAAVCAAFLMHLFLIEVKPKLNA